MSKIVAIPKQLSKKGELVIIPRSDYEELLRLKKVIPLVKPTLSEKKAIQSGRREIKRKKYLTLKQLKDELED
ncbi:MAG: hypothetical protein KJI71_01105 [Patescibacteria group bacterium]|nr:hypothetical protein [Patescibacteria group bacterium]